MAKAARAAPNQPHVRGRGRAGPPRGRLHVADGMVYVAANGPTPGKMINAANGERYRNRFYNTHLYHQNPDVPLLADA